MVLFFMSVAALSSLLFAGLASTSLLFVPEGHVAVYFRGGRLLQKTAGPGFHSALPLVTRVEVVQTTVQTDKVLNIPCGTKGGTIIEFEKVEVVNQLDENAVLEMVKNYTIHYDQTWIFDKIHHEVNQICSRSTLEEMYISKFDTLDETLTATLQRDIDVHAPGIRIIAIRVTKPSIPLAIRANYEAIETERTRLQVAEETQRVIEKEAETEKRRAIINAQTVAAVEAVELERTLKVKQTEQKLAEIANDMHAAKERAAADAAFYRVSREAEANKLLHTPALLQLEAVRALSNNTKVFWGERLPTMYAEGAGAGLLPSAGLDAGA